MRIRDMLLILVVLISFSGCYVGPPTYEVWKHTMDINLGAKMGETEEFYKTRNRKKIYDKNHYIYIFEYPKNCIVGYLVKKNDKKRVSVGWVVISGKKYCKERQATVLVQ